MITLDLGSSVPPFEQLRSGIAERIRDGRLPAGTRLPPVRRLAESLELAPNTVARAYRELEIAGLVETAGRRGTVVAATGDFVSRAAAAAAASYADTVHRLGLPTQDAVALARAALEARDRQHPAGAIPAQPDRVEPERVEPERVEPERVEPDDVGATDGVVHPDPAPADPAPASLPDTDRAAHPAGHPVAQPATNPAEQQASVDA